MLQCAVLGDGLAETDKTRVQSKQISPDDFVAKYERNLELATTAMDRGYLLKSRLKQSLQLYDISNLCWT
jgi:hypothetical protein